MPIGSSKLGVLGAGLVPGGSVTFNASGTWPIPPGVKKVSITGKGGTGNPGVAGNAGNPGNSGSGGGGGQGAGGNSVGGAAFNLGPVAAINTQLNGPQISFSNWNQAPPGSGLLPRVVKGGDTPPSISPGQSGQGGNAGNAGTAGNPGNTGQCSSGLGNNFAGGAGGNAPPGGTAGNAGSGGQGGTGGPGPFFCRPPAQAIPGGAGGNGGGAGGTNVGTPSPARFVGATGGGGAGATNDGQPGTPKTNPCANQQASAQGGNDPGATAVVLQPSPPQNPNIGWPVNGSVNQTGGRGALANAAANALATVHRAWCVNPFATNPVPCTNPPSIPARGNRFVNEPSTSNLWRAGGGGGSGTGSPPVQANWGAGGGGGRGNAGNAGGNSPTVSGSAANPATFNCVPVTPGTPTPITVGTPGGQIVISWNPQ
jgi:hypothetical protein